MKKLFKLSTMFMIIFAFSFCFVGCKSTLQKIHVDLNEGTTDFSATTKINDVDKQKTIDKNNDLNI